MTRGYRDCTVPPLPRSCAKNRWESILTMSCPSCGGADPLGLPLDLFCCNRSRFQGNHTKLDNRHNLVQPQNTAIAWPKQQKPSRRITTRPPCLFGAPSGPTLNCGPNHAPLRSLAALSVNWKTLRRIIQVLQVVDTYVHLRITHCLRSQR